MTHTPNNDWPGKKFGLPESGPRSTPSYLRRVGALAIDWAIAVTVSIFFSGAARFPVGQTLTDVVVDFLAIISEGSGLETVVFFVVFSALSGLFLAGTPGHLAARIRIAPITGGALGIVAPLVRPLLIALVLPALLTDDDMRGAHDRLVGTILVLR